MKKIIEFFLAIQNFNLYEANFIVQNKPEKENQSQKEEESEEASDDEEGDE